MILITGGTGFIGHSLVPELARRGHKLRLLVRRAGEVTNFSGLDVESVVGDVMRAESLLPAVEGVEGVIHMAGATIFGRWNEKVKKAIYDSRIVGTRNLVAAIARSQPRPRVLVSASAVGYYGDRAAEDLDESSSQGSDFLAKVCIDWEKEAQAAEALGLRTVQVRTAPVMGRGGMLGVLLPFFRLGLGGPLAGGKQWFPWVSIQDITNIYVFALENEALRGPLNACSPQPVTNKQFSKALGSVLRRPAFFNVPRWALRLAYGEFADFAAASQKVHPRKLTEAGYTFAVPDIKQALERAVRGRRAGL